MPPFISPTGCPRIKYVDSFPALAATPFAEGVNALCWPRTLPGDFGEVVKLIGTTEWKSGSEGIITLDDAGLLALRSPGRLRRRHGRVNLGEAGVAIDIMLEDLRRLRELGRDPVLNCIHAYPRDEEPGPVVTDVFSFHADSAPVEADTWLCTYHGAPSEGLRNEDALRRVDLPATRAELLKAFGGADDDAFREFLRENCYDLHYAPVSTARPYSFGVGNLWRIACEYTGPSLPRHSSQERRRVPPCIHRAPETKPGEARLLLIA